MNQPDVELRNRILDSIIADRRTHRFFTGETVSDAAIMEVINAGLHAPYAGAAILGEKEYF